MGIASKVARSLARKITKKKTAATAKKSTDKKKPSKAQIYYINKAKKKKKNLKLTAEMLDQPIFDTLTLKQKEEVLHLAYRKDPDLFMDVGGSGPKKKNPEDGLAVMVAVGKVKKPSKKKMMGGGYSKPHNYFAGGSVTNNLKRKR